MEKEKEPLWTKDYIVALIIMFGINAIMGMLTSTLSIYGKGLTNSDIFAGLLATSFTVTALLARLVVGKLFELFSLKRVLLIGSLITTIACGGYLLTISEVGIILCRMLHGLGFGIASTAAATYITSSLPRSRLLEGVGYSGMMGTVTMALGPSIVLAITKSDYRLFVYAFFICLAISALSLLFALFLPETHQSRRADNNEHSGRSEVEKIGMATFIPAGIMLVIMFNQSSVSTFLSVHALEKQLGNISMFFMINALFSFLIRLVTTQIVDFFTEKRVIVVSMITAALCLVGIAYSNGLWVLIALAAPYGAACGLLSPIFNVRILNTVSDHQQGKANAIYYSSFDIGIGMGAIVWSSMAKYTGYSLTFVASGILMAVCMIVFLMTVSSGKKVAKVEKIYSEC